MVSYLAKHSAENPEQNDQSCSRSEGIFREEIFREGILRRNLWHVHITFNLKIRIGYGGKQSGGKLSRGTQEDLQEMSDGKSMRRQYSLSSSGMQENE